MNYLQTPEARQLYKVLLSLKSEKETAQFLGDLLTPAEIKEFANRWQVVKLLDKKTPYETITEKTGMSSTTIARIQKWLNGTLGGYKLMLKRVNKKILAKNHHHTPLAAV